MKRKTFFFDIDGTLIDHHTNKLTIQTLEKFKEIEKNGHCIIITTARRESQRAITEKQLSDLGLFWDQLIMGIGNGERILINDKDLDGSCRARALSLDRDEGLFRLVV